MDHLKQGWILIKELNHDKYLLRHACMNKWMHWSTTGLENLLNILLVRYCNQKLYSKLRKILEPREQNIDSHKDNVGEKVNQLTDGTK